MGLGWGESGKQGKQMIFVTKQKANKAIISCHNNKNDRFVDLGNQGYNRPERMDGEAGLGGRRKRASTALIARGKV